MLTTVIATFPTCEERKQSYPSSPLAASKEGIKEWGAMTVEIITNYPDMILEVKDS